MNHAIEILKNDLEKAYQNIYDSQKQIKKQTDKYTENLTKMYNIDNTLKKLGYNYKIKYYTAFTNRVYAKISLIKNEK